MHPRPYSHTCPSPYLQFLRLAAVCTAAEFSTYVGDQNEYKTARIVVDAAGNTYAAGARVISAAGANPSTLSDVFVTKLDASGNTIFMASLSGKGDDQARAIALDAAGNIFVAGATSSSNFPVRNALYGQKPQGYSGFITKLSPDGSRILYSTYFPGEIHAIAADSSGNLYVTGTTNNPDFPVTAGLPHGPVGGGVPIILAAFVTKISPDGSEILYSALISGDAVACGCCSSCFLSTRMISGDAIAVDSAGNAYVGGNANVTDLPVTAAAALSNGIGAFVAKIAVNGTSLDYLTYLGATNWVAQPYGTAANRLAAIAVDADGNAYAAGSTTDPNVSRDACRLPIAVSRIGGDQRIVTTLSD